MDRTFLMIKPDGVQRGLVGEIIARFEKKGLKMVAAEHTEKPFFAGLKAYITSGPCFLMVWEGKNIVAITRQMIGATNPAEAAPGTIRGDCAMEIGMNVIHGSDSDETAAREIAIHFAPEELNAYTRIDEAYLYE
jgi:nucleoside-diphosphate kinase